MALIAHYLMNDNAANSTVADDTGNGNTGALKDKNGAVLTSANTTTGKINEALLFDSSDEDCIDITNSNLPSSGAISVAMWFRTDDISQNRILMSYSNTASFVIGFLNGAFVAENGNEGLATASDFFSNNTWHHIVCIYTDSELDKIYVDSVDKGTEAAGNHYNVDDMMIGARDSTNIDYAWKGEIDDIRIYNETLSQAQVTAIFNGGSGTEAANPSAGWANKVCGVSSPAKVNGVANASIASVSGV